MKALLFDCDGVILESEDLHRRAYNAAFKHFGVMQAGKISEWSTECVPNTKNIASPTTVNMPST